MKLCRFVLHEDPSILRAGIFLDDQVYETDGVKAFGIHQLDKVRFLPPLGQPPTVRFFDLADDGLRYHYVNPTRMGGAMAEFDVPPYARNLDFNVRIGIAIKDSGLAIQKGEAMSFVLGLTTVISFQSFEDGREDLTWSRSHDFPLLVGPFITTPEELEEKVVDQAYKFGYTIHVNGEEIMHQEHLMPVSFEQMIEYCSAGNELQGGDLIAGPTLPKLKLAESDLKRPLLPGDTLQVGVDSLGLLTAKII